MKTAEIGRMLLTAAAAFLMAAAVPLMFSDASEANPLTQEEEYYYNQLSYTDQGLYRQVYGAALSFDGGYFATGLDEDYLEENALNVVFAVRCDHPELYYLEGSIEYSSSGDLKLSFSETRENYTKEIAEIEDAAEEMLSGIPENRYLAMKWLNSKLVLNTTYEDDDDVRAHNISGVFIDKSAVCEGYGLALCYLCDMLGIPCIAVIGEAGGGTDYGDHMWNYVMMGEQWFAVDVTWNDPDMGISVSTEFLLVGSETVNGGLKFSESHIPGDVSAYVELPEIEKTAYTATTGEDTPPAYGTVVNRYYDTLTAKQKKAYDMLLEKVLAFDEEYIKSGLTEKSDQEAVFYALYYGRPDLFYIDAMGYVPGTDEFGAAYSCTQDEYLGSAPRSSRGCPRWRRSSPGATRCTPGPWPSTTSSARTWTTSSPTRTRTSTAPSHSAKRYARE